MCECFDNVYNCICCVLYCLYCVFLYYSFMNSFSYVLSALVQGLLPPSDNSIAVSSHHKTILKRVALFCHPLTCCDNAASWT
jgi:hypothetical protein